MFSSGTWSQPHNYLVTFWLLFYLLNTFLVDHFMIESLNQNCIHQTEDQQGGKVIWNLLWCLSRERYDLTGG